MKGTSRSWPHVLALVMRETLIVGTIGGVLGLAEALALTRAMANMPYGVSVTDMGTMAAAFALLLMAALLASYVPARRAASIRPMSALKAE